MTPIQRLQRDLSARFPKARVELDPPREEGGPHFLDVALDGQAVVIEWSPQRGFGLSSTPTDDYGGGPDEVYTNGAAVLGRVSELLRIRSRTSPPQAVSLRVLRHGRGLSQQELGCRLGREQSSVSRLEGRRDFYVSTLRDVISALGGHLVLRAEFPDGMVKVLTFGDEPEEPPEGPRHAAAPRA
jgi:hypothetical protein